MENTTVYMANDPASKFISMLIPVVVAECARRFDDIEIYGHSPQNGDYSLMHLAEKVSADMVRECDFDLEPSDEECPSKISTVLGGSIEESDLTPVQNLKLDLLDLFKELREDLLAEIKDSIKDELRMELFLELEKLRADMVNNKNGTSHNTTAKKEFTTGVLPGFSLDIKPAKIKKVTGGFESIATTVRFEQPDKTNEDVENNLLANNPLFARVTKNIDRAKSGKSMYTVEEAIEARGERFDLEHKELFRSRAAESKYELESSDDEENEKWNKLLQDRLNAGY